MKEVHSGEAQIKILQVRDLQGEDREQGVAVQVEHSQLLERLEMCRGLGRLEQQTLCQYIL
eukprot:724458-Rhodomonas_salina.2